MVAQTDLNVHAHANLCMYLLLVTYASVYFRLFKNMRGLLFSGWEELCLVEPKVQVHMYDKVFLFSCTPDIRIFLNKDI